MGSEVGKGQIGAAEKDGPLIVEKNDQPQPHKEKKSLKGKISNLGTKARSELADIKESFTAHARDAKEKVTSSAQKVSNKIKGKGGGKGI